MVEFWRSGSRAHSSPEAIQMQMQMARKVEAEGWDGQMFMDSQSLSADPYVRMGAWAAVTERLKLCTGVTNAVTRHPAVTATSAATLQAISSGRAVLGIGRGDSALAFLGRGPGKVSEFERALRDLQKLLSGGEVSFASVAGDATPSLDTLSLGHKPGAMRLEWLPKDLPKVPLDVAATGPRVIELSATIAERITLSVGAIPERLQWALGVAREARTRCGMGNAGIQYGAQVIVVCHTDKDIALDFAATLVLPIARFQIIQGQAAGPTTTLDDETFQVIRQGYDMTRHGLAQGLKLSPEFVRRFAIVGPPEHCTQRLLELIRVGLKHLVVVGPGIHPEARNDGRPLFTSEVMPAVRAALKST